MHMAYFPTSIPVILYGSPSGVGGGVEGIGVLRPQSIIGLWKCWFLNPYSRVKDQTYFTSA